MASSTIVSLQEVSNFHNLSFQNAQDIIYKQLVPACEAKGIFLSSYGNHAGQNSLCKVEEYNLKKNQCNLFNVKRIQKAFNSMQALIQNTSSYQTGSYGLKNVVEAHQKSSISNGDLIATMLLKGYSANFGSPAKVNCTFMVKYK